MDKPTAPWQPLHFQKDQQAREPEPTGEEKSSRGAEKRGTLGLQKQQPKKKAPPPFVKKSEKSEKSENPKASSGSAKAKANETPKLEEVAAAENGKALENGFPACEALAAKEHFEGLEMSGAKEEQEISKVFEAQNWGRPKVFEI